MLFACKQRWGAFIITVPTYVALLRKQADSDFGVEFPDFPGCITAGITLEDARRMAAEALLFHVEGMMEDGSQPPKPSRLDETLADPRYSGTVAVLVDLPTSLAIVGPSQYPVNKRRFIGD